jgi:carbonic anhydrase
VELTLQQISEKSEVLREMLHENAIGVVGAMYDVNTGIVDFYA